MSLFGRAAGGLLVSVALAGTACGGGSGSGVATLGGSSESPSADRTWEDAALAYAECMREQGIPMSDQQVSEGQIAIDVDSGIDIDEMNAADVECRHHLEGVEPPAGDVQQISPEEQERVFEQMLEFAQCMREEGIDFPDPQRDGEGMIMFGPSGDVDLDDPDFRAAEETCRQHLPGLQENDAPGGDS